MKNAFLLFILVVVGAAAHAGEPIAPGQTKLPALGGLNKSPTTQSPAPDKAIRPSLQQVRVPRVTSVGSGITRRFYMFEPLQIDLAGLGTPGQVRVTVYPFTGMPPGSLDFTAGGPQPTGCFFSGQVGNSSPAVIAEDGTAIARFLGFWIPRRRDDVQRAGSCRIEVRVERLQPNLSYNVEARLASGLISVAAHEKVDVPNTARLRNYLRPVASANCKADDDAGKFALQITSGVVAHGCRTDFLNPLDSSHEPTLNKLREGIFLDTVSWKLEGDTGRCELCQNPLIPCRGVGIVLVAFEDFYNLHWIYHPVGWPGAHWGESFALFTGPPIKGSGALIEVNARSYDYDTSMPDYVTNAISGGTTYSAAVIGKNDDGRWHSWMRPFGIGMACSMWSPPSASDAKQAIGGAIGQLSQGQAPAPPPAPYLRLVLDRIVLWRPVGQRLPWE